MRVNDFISRIEKAIQENRYLEAFVLKSIYVESIITTLATAKKFHEKNFDGNSLSVAVEIKKDAELKKLYEESMRDKLSSNIKSLRGAFFFEEKQADYLYTWKDKYRDEIFHNFGELMLRGILEIESKKGLEFMEKFTNQTWFKHVEETFRRSEQNIINSSTSQ